MVDLVLEFGCCSSCYLQKDINGKYINCDADCTVDLNIDLNPFDSLKTPSNYFYQGLNRAFRVKKRFFHGKAVPDVYRYDLKFYNGQWQLFEPNSNPPQIASMWETKDQSNNNPKEIIKNNQSAKNILIILESPHEDEYAYSPDFAPLQPANGDTGKRFHEYFTKIPYSNGTASITTGGGILTSPLLENSLNHDDEYRICFVNPVPFQTSLHYILSNAGGRKIGINTEIRDAVWKKLFIQCESDFIRRVDLYKPFMILNACTGGKKGLKDSNSLKYRVKTSINKLACSHNIPKFNTAHPCRWDVLNNRYCDEW